MPTLVYYYNLCNKLALFLGYKKILKEKEIPLLLSYKARSMPWLLPTTQLDFSTRILIFAPYSKINGLTLVIYDG